MIFIVHVIKREIVKKPMKILISYFSVENKIFFISPYKLFFFLFLLNLMQPDLTSVPGLNSFI
jgi:hypothetical protein